MKPIRNNFFFLNFGFTGKVVAVMHGANAPLMKVYNALITIIGHTKNIFFYMFRCQIKCPIEVRKECEGDGGTGGC